MFGARSGSSAAGEQPSAATANAAATSKDHGRGFVTRSILHQLEHGLPHGAAGAVHPDGVAGARIFRSLFIILSDRLLHIIRVASGQDAPQAGGARYLRKTRFVSPGIPYVGASLCACRREAVRVPRKAVVERRCERLRRMNEPRPDRLRRRILEEFLLP